MIDSSILHNFPQWEKMKKELEDDFFNDSLWNELVLHHEKLIADHKELLKSRTELKSLIYADMDQLLAKYPYFTVYWKRYVTMVYTLEGLQSSIRVLERAVVSFPYSLDVWVDYVNILLANKIKADREMNEIFLQGADKIGCHFLAHQFWDIYLDWAKSVYGTHSNDYIAILIRITKIPLHQYAKYNQEFMKLSRNFAITDLVQKDDLLPYVKKKYDGLNEEEIEEYIENRSEKLIRLFFGDILSQVEARAQEKWKFESVLKTDFDLNMITLEELDQWIKYLENEESYHKTRREFSDIDEVIALYERALVPTCLSDQVWIRYARFLIRSESGNDRIMQVFNRACDHFVPLDLKEVRYMYAKYIELKLGDFEKCKQVYLSLISKSPTETEPVSKYIDLLILHQSDESTDVELVRDILNCVYKFNQEKGPIDHSSKKRKANRPTKGQTQSTFELVSPNIQDLYDKLTFWNVGQLVVSVCKYYWFTKKNVKLTRDTLMSFFNTFAVKSSKVFWFFFFRFELCQRNKKNLANIVNEVRTASTLSISDINIIIEQYNSFFLKNFTVTELKENQRDLIKNMLETDIESSLHMKHYLKVRLAEDNDEETTNRRLIKENGHPAATCEGRPTLTNPLLISENTYDTSTVPALPRFRNVEKASLNAKYIHESL